MFLLRSEKAYFDRLGNRWRDLGTVFQISNLGRKIFSTYLIKLLNIL